jgi:hypothetical protein
MSGYRERSDRLLSISPDRLLKVSELIGVFCYHKYMISNDPGIIQSKLRSDLMQAKKDRNAATSEILEVLIGTIDNASAVTLTHNNNGSFLGVGSSEVPRHEVSIDDIKVIIENEIADINRAVNEFNKFGITPPKELNDKIMLLEAYLR